MRLARVEVTGYRSLERVDVPFAGLTAFIGPNGSGKSSILGAVRLFFESRRGVEELDFWVGKDGAAAAEITVRLTFVDLKSTEVDRFEAYVDDAQRLVVERRFEEPGQGAYLAFRRGVREFAAIRNQSTGHRASLNELVNSGKFDGLTKVPNKAAVFEAMAAWEAANPDRCEILEDRFDAISELAQAMTFIYVGAFEDPGDHLGADGAGAIGRLLERVIDRSVITNELQQVADEASSHSNEILTKSKARFAEFEKSVGKNLESFAPGCRVRLGWQESAVRRADPRLTITIETSDGLQRPLSFQGHGVQRSLMYGALTAEVSGSSAKGTVLLIIEEPEAFQHPLSCRVLSRTLRRLSQGDYQIAYSTHSPEFIHADIVDGMRIVQRDNRSGRGSSTFVESLTKERLVAEWGRVFEGVDVTTASVMGRLRTHLTPSVLAGLFARACVLVEGAEDEAYVVGSTLHRGIELDAVGVAVIQTGGKPAMPSVLAFLQLAGVPCYPVFDLDRSGPAADQHHEAEDQILRALEAAETVAPGVHGKYACWEDKIGAEVRRDLGQRWSELRDQAADRLGYWPPSHANKAAPAIAEVLRLAYEEGLSSAALEKLVDQIAVIATDSAA